MDFLKESLVTVMDLLDLDESIVDLGLHRIMNQKCPTENHLKNALILLQYKLLINFHEDTECDNNKEFEFVAKLVSNSENFNINQVCRIINIVLSLNPSSLENKAEHFLQQLFYDMIVNSVPTEEDKLTLIKKLKFVDCVLDSLIQNKQKITLLFVEVPLSHILYSNEHVQKHFLTVSVPKFIETVNGYNILNEIWNCIIKRKGEENVTLMALICLSDYFLPMHNKTLYFVCDIVLKNAFWEIILNGLKQPKLRKMSIYLAKRGVDCISQYKKNVELKNDSGEIIFQWFVGNEIEFTDMWHDYFVLMESLEEKQSNIVLPSLQLIKKLVNFGDCWLECVFKMALEHGNVNVRKKCLDYRLNHELLGIAEAKSLLYALNDVNMYDDVPNWCDLKYKMEMFMSNHENLKQILNIFPTLNWSSIPLYYLSEVFKGIKTDLLLCVDEMEIIEIINDFLNLNCNNLIIKRAVHKNLFYFICNTCKNLSWHSFTKILPNLLLSIKHDVNLQKILMPIIEKMHQEDGQNFLQYTMNNYLYLDLTLLYLLNNPVFITDYVLILSEKISMIQTVVYRQYAIYTECLKEFMYIANLIKKLVLKEYTLISTSTETVMRDCCPTLVKYISKMLSDSNEMRQDEMETFLKTSTYVVKHYNDHQEAKIHLMDLYKMALVSVHNAENHPRLTVLSLSTVINIIGLDIIKSHHQNEIFNLENFLQILTLSKRRFDESDEKIDGRLINSYFENICLLLYNYIKHEQIMLDTHLLHQVMFFIANILDYGGYGCLQWILKIIDSIQSLLSIEGNPEYTKMMSMCWKEIQELKSNKEFLPCLREFINVLTSNVLLKESVCHDFLMSYFKKIIEFGSLNHMPLYYLTSNIETKIISKDNLPLTYVLSDVLLFCPIPKKDIRFTDNIIKNILRDMFEESKINRKMSYHFYYEIQNKAVAALLKVDDLYLFDLIQANIIMKIDTVFKNKQRYHGDSESHRIILSAVRHMLFLSLLSDKIDFAKTVRWCIHILSKLPHQPSVRVCLEWYISLYLIEEKQEIGKDACDEINLCSLPLLSQFVILYFVIKHKISVNSASIEEYKYVMEFLLRHTMGQIYNVRLHAQYLAYQLFKIRNFKDHTSAYNFTINLIEHTFQENSHENSYVRIHEDYFINEFDVIKCLTPSFIYCFLPKYFGVGRHEVLENTHLPTTEDCEQYIRRSHNKRKFVNIWLNTTKLNTSVVEKSFNIDFIKKDTEAVEDSTIIQKKYIPWKNMSEIMLNKSENSETIKNESTLVVVATLVDKLPNLGGIARTGEVFGVKSYVVDSLRHLQDKQFQGLSLSAEQWINIEEVRPGKPLKEYLLKKKTDGYTLVAAEQTSSSVKLNNFNFPEKSLLLLGHEKAGVPCDLLPLMDQCVEIPQKGYIRSLNVHVTAAIFIWEYVRQHVL